jgi:hypothetical protein
VNHNRAEVNSKAEEDRRAIDRRSFLKVAGGAIGAAALSQVVPFVRGRAEAATTALYSLQNIGSLPPFELTTGSGQNVGLAYRAAWKFTEPKRGVYDWSKIDLALNAALVAGVPFALSITAGGKSPTWIYAAGAQSFEFSESDSVTTMPVPWDPMYKLLWINFMQAVGARYGTQVSRIALTGINSSTQETLLPQNNGALDDWIAIDYSNEKVQQAWKDIGTNIVSSFPSNVPVVGMHGNFFLPSLANNPDSTPDLINFGVAKWPNYAMQNNGAGGSSRKLWAGVNDYVTRYPGRTLGLQAANPTGMMFTQETVTQAESLGAAWLELYPPDLQYI